MNAFDILDGLLALNQSGKEIKEFFEANDIGKVAVYGLGRVGVRVIDEIRNAGVEIVCGIDRDAGNIQCDTLKIISPDDIKPSDDYELIIVTPAEHYYDIKEDLEQITDKDIISISEIVEYCLDGEEEFRPRIRRISAIQEMPPRVKIDREKRSRKVLIFGGGSGIGKAIALSLIKGGADVVIAGRNAAKLDNVMEEYNLQKDKNESNTKKQGQLYTLEADISIIKDHESYFKSAEESMEGLDAFVNAAAITLETRGRGYEPWDITEAEWDEISDTDFKAAFFLMRNEVDYFQDKGIAGNILNFSSNAACMDITGLYGAAKLSITRWTRAFGKRYGHEGIVINAIAPGATFTPIISSYAHDINQPYPRHAIDRFIRPEEIAELACFMMSKKGVILCGSTVIADGGDANTVL